jgi:hypothetical protein
MDREVSALLRRMGQRWTNGAAVATRVGCGDSLRQKGDSTVTVFPPNAVGPASEWKNIAHRTDRITGGMITAFSGDHEVIAGATATASDQVLDPSKHLPDGKRVPVTRDLGAEPLLRICAHCRHQRMRAELELFSAADLQTPAILKAQVEWDQQRRQRAQQETQRVAAGLPFEYEPHHFAWCAAFTPLDLAHRASKGDPAALSELMAQGAGVINPVTGEVGPIYALCVQKNADGQCQRYEAK